MMIFLKIIFVLVLAFCLYLAWIDINDGFGRVR